VDRRSLRKPTLVTMWEQHREYLRRMLTGLLNDPNIVDDLLQETYLRACRGFADFRGGDDRAWLTAIARNAVRMYHRQTAARAEVPFDDDIAPENLVGYDQDQHLLYELRQAVVTLPPHLQHAIILKHYAGFSYREIARRLGCPVGTARWRVFTAIGQLREMLGITTGRNLTMKDELKQSVLEQLQLPPLRFTVELGNLPPRYAGILLVEVTEVFGSSPVIAVGENYLACGEYTLDEPCLESMVLAISGAMTGYHQFLTPGTHPFTLYGNVQRVDATTGDLLHIRIFPEGGNFAILYLRIIE